MKNSKIKLFLNQKEKNNQKQNRTLKFFLLILSFDTTKISSIILNFEIICLKSSLLKSGHNFFIKFQCTKVAIIKSYSIFVYYQFLLKFLDLEFHLCINFL